MRTKNLILTLLVVCCTTGLCAQTPKSAGKMSAWLRNQYQQQQEAVMKSGGSLRVQGHPVRNYILALVESTDEAATIRQKGGVVWQDCWTFWASPPSPYLVKHYRGFMLSLTRRDGFSAVSKYKRVLITGPAKRKKSSLT